MHSSTVLVITLALAVLLSPREAAAVPAFARQTGMACNVCHHQAFPSLNAFGRAFKADGYAMTGGHGLIEGDYLSLPMSLNMSLIAELRYDKTNGNTDTGSDKGQIQWPDEAAFLVGGKLADNAGFLVEAGLAGIVVPVEGEVVSGTTVEGEGRSGQPVEHPPGRRQGVRPDGPAGPQARSGHGVSGVSHPGQRGRG